MTKAVARHVSNRRLLKLADFLATEVKAEKFDLTSWAELEKDSLKHGCGTTACAAGWACEIPSFRRAGLKMIPKVSTSSWFQPDNADHVYTILTYKDSVHMDAAKDFFGLTYYEAEQLFDPDKYEYKAKKGVVIKRIRDFVRNRKVAVI